MGKLKHGKTYHPVTAGPEVIKLFSCLTLNVNKYNNIKKFGLF